jgi:hypothetical protein
MNLSSRPVRFAMIAIAFIAFVTVVQKAADRWAKIPSPTAGMEPPPGIEGKNGKSKASVAPDTDFATYTGEVYHECDEPYVVIRFLFRRSAVGHIGAMGLFKRFADEHPTRVLVAGLVDESSLSSRPNAMPLKSKHDTIQVNGKEEFNLPGAGSASRKVRFKGFEGKSYQLSDLERVIQLELMKRKMQPHPPAPP